MLLQKQCLDRVKENQIAGYPINLAADGKYDSPGEGWKFAKLRSGAASASLGGLVFILYFNLYIQPPTHITEKINACECIRSRPNFLLGVANQNN